MFVVPLLLVSSLLAQADPPPAVPAEAPSAEAIAKAIRELGADDFQVREKATEFLWRAGPAALPSLEKALSIDDFEIKFRVQGLLDKVRYGITPDTPAAVAKLLDSFRKGDVSVKQSVLRQLKDKGESKIILQLLRVEKDPNFQRIADDFFRNELNLLLPQLIVKGDFAEVEQLLSQNALQDTVIQRLAAFWVLRGKAETQSAALREKLAKGEDPVARRQLVWLLRAMGDSSAAAAAAEPLGDKALSELLAVENRDWKGAAKLAAAMEGPFDAPLPELTRLISWQRRAGDQAAADKSAEALRKRAEENIRDVWGSAKALLLSERAGDGINALRKDMPAVAFRLLAYRSDWDGALQFAGVEPTTVFTRDWYNKLPSQERTTINVHRFVYAADIMRQLHWLGRKDDAANLRKLLLEIADDPENRNLNFRVTLSALELRAGMEEEALQDAADALNTPGGHGALARFFPKHYGSASLWWDFLRQQYPTQKPRETLAMLQQLVRTSEKQPPLKGWEEVIAKAADKADGLDPPHRGQWLRLIAETCAMQGNRDMALKYAKSAVEGLPVAGLVYGQLLTDDKQHQTAADVYLKVWENDNGQVLALHLAGKALIAAGKLEEGQKKLELASLLCLDAAVRRNVGFALHERGLSDDAIPYYELAVRTGPPESWHVSNAAENLGNLLVKKDPLRAADLWERLQIYLLQPSANPNEFEPLLDIGRLIHKTRARGLLEAGKKDESLAEIKLCEEISPGNIDLAEDLVPLLKAKGFPAEAKALYDRAYAVHAPLALKYPESAACRNNVAWLSAVCHERLDEALADAQKAVELAPKAPSYLDTLAEVHFQKGDRPKAVELGKQVLQLAPGNKLYAERLERFENDPLPK